MRLTNDSATSRVALAQMYALTGQGAEAERLLGRALLERPNKYVSPGAIANAYVALGQDEKAFDWPSRRTVSVQTIWPTWPWSRCTTASGAATLPGPSESCGSPMTQRSAGSTDITPLLTKWGQGNRDAFDRVLPLVYGELRRIAARQLRREGDGHALDPTDLVHALFVQLVDQRHATWSNRAQFFATTAQMMRRILVDCARARQAAKRGGSAITMSLSALTAEPTLHQTPVSDVLAIDHALERLAEHDADQARIVELRFFAGLSVEEAAHVMGVSARTVKREWRMAKVWLFVSYGSTANHVANSATPRALRGRVHMLAEVPWPS